MELTLTPGTLLDGRVRYWQAETGYRTGLEPVLLAASVPARPGQTVVEGGTGAGAGLLCLAARLPGLSCIGIERDAGTAELARRNMAENGLDPAAIMTGDVLSWGGQGPYDHAMANPPWHAHAGTASPDSGRDQAKRGRPGLLAGWAAALGRGLRARGTLSLIIPASLLAEGVAALAAAQCPEITTIPLWPRQGVAARLVILRGVRLGGGPCVLHPGLVLHDEGAGFTAEADAILRGGGSLI